MMVITLILFASPIILITLLFLYALFNQDPPFDFLMYILLTLPLVGIDIQVIMSNYRLGKLKEDSAYAKSNYVVILAVVIAIFLIYIMNFPNTFIEGYSAAVIIVAGWITAIVLYFTSSLFVCLQIPNSGSMGNKFKTIPKSYLVFAVIILVLSIIFIGVAGATITKTDLKIDVDGIEVEETQFGYDIEVTVVNEGGMPAEGNITLAVRDTSFEPGRIIIIDRINKIDGFGKWQVRFALPSTNNATIVLFYNGEKIHDAYFYQCDIITAMMITVTGVLYQRRKSIRSANKLRPFFS